MKRKLAFFVLVAFVLWCVWLQLTDRYDFRAAWDQGTPAYNRGVRSVR
jgi:hypothetical protein